MAFAVSAAAAPVLYSTPAYEVYSSASTSSLPRVLKVVGRNLQPAAGATTQVRLVGANATYTLPADDAKNSDAALQDFVAESLTDVGLSAVTTTGIGQSAVAGALYPFEWQSVQYANVCGGTPPTTLVRDFGRSTVNYCPAAPANDCECAPASN